MTELHYIFARSLDEKEFFLRHVVPVVLDDARIDTPEDRIEHARYWHEKVAHLHANRDLLGGEDRQRLRLMRRWAEDVGDMLSFIADQLAPRGFDAVTADEFRAIRELLDRPRSH
jgi:hypothetical protein